MVKHCFGAFDFKEMSLGYLDFSDSERNQHNSKATLFIYAYFVHCLCQFHSTSYCPRTNTKKKQQTEQGNCESSLSAINKYHRYNQVTQQSDALTARAWAVQDRGAVNSVL